MAKAKVKSFERIEIWLTKTDSHYIRKHICKEGESRKEAIERIITKEILRVAKLQQSLIKLS